MTAVPAPRPPLPPFTVETALQKVLLDEDGWNTRDADKVCLATTEVTRRRDRTEFRDIFGFESDGDVRLHRLAEHAHMLAVYTRFGGLLAAERYVSRIREHVSQPLSQVARWIAGRELVLVADQTGIDIPLFQFDAMTGGRLPVVERVLAELRDTHSDWDIALWFTLPDPQLQGRMPIELVGADGHEVHDAARAHRFAVTG